MPSGTGSSRHSQRSDPNTPDQTAAVKCRSSALIAKPQRVFRGALPAGLRDIVLVVDDTLQEFVRRRLVDTEIGILRSLAPERPTGQHTGNDLLDDAVPLEE